MAEAQGPARASAPADAGGPGGAAPVRGAAKGPNYTKPHWAGAPAVGEGEWALELIVKGEVRKRVPLDVGEHSAFLIGRAKNADVSLEGLEPQSSRFHCVLQFKAGCPEVYVYDLGSAHGTLLNGRPVDPRTFMPMRVGEQLRFCAQGPKPAVCTAVLCGPDEAMGEEGEVDLTEFREQSAKELAELEADLARRKAAKKARMHQQAGRLAHAKAMAQRAQEYARAKQDAVEEDRHKIHEVTWGFAEDAVELPDDDLSEQAQKLMGADGKLDTEKVRALKLSEKQEKLVTLLEQKQRKVANLQREKSRMEGFAAENETRAAAAERDIDEMPQHLKDKAGKTLEKLNKLEEKIMKAEEDAGAQVDNLLLSLGMRSAGFRKQASKRQAQLYDTTLEGEDEDFFDRTKQKAKQGDKGAVASGAEASEFAGVPTLDKVENRASLESKALLLKAERGKLLAQLAMEAAKAKRREAEAAAQGGQEKDALDEYMGSTLDEIRQDRGAKLQRRLSLVESRAAEAERMLVVARRNEPEPQVPASVGKVPAPGSARPSAPAADAPAAGAAAGAGAAPQDDAASKVLSAAAPTGTRDADPPSQQRPPAGEPRGAQGAAPSARAPGEASETAAPKRAARGPQRPSPAELAQAAAAAAAPPAGADAAAPKRVARGPQRPSPAELAQAAAAAAAAPEPPPAAAAAASPAGAGGKAALDPSLGGLQVMKRPLDAGAADASAMPPPKAKVRREPGAAPPPSAASSRDADMAASGELEEPEG